MTPEQADVLSNVRVDERELPEWHPGYAFTATIRCAQCGAYCDAPGPAHICPLLEAPPAYPVWLKDGETAAKVFSRIIGAASNGAMVKTIRYKIIQELMEHGLAERQCLSTCDSRQSKAIFLACNCEGEWVDGKT